MRVRELIFQGLFGTTTPVRIQADEPIAAAHLPSGVSERDIQYLFISLLYPEDTPYSLRSEYARGEGIKIAARFVHREREYRLVRKASGDSVRLQAQEGGGWRDLKTGALQVGTFLKESLELPDLPTFWAVNLWLFDESVDEATAIDVEVLDGRVRDVIEKYRVAHAVEAIEDEITVIESDLAEATKDLGRGASLEDKLRKAKEKLEEISVDDLTLEDLELMRNKDEVIADHEEQLDRLHEDEDLELQRIDETLPQQWWQSPIFWVGFIVGVGSLIVSMMFPHDLRMVALLDIAGFLACAWVLINYFSDMEQANVHQVRLESIKRRTNQVREDLISMQERIDHVLVHVGARDERELEERLGKSHKLGKIVEKLEDEVESMRQNPEYLAAVEEVSRLEEVLRQKRAERKEMPTVMMSAYQLETDLEQMGFDPRHVLNNEEGAEDEAKPYERILEAARQTGLFKDSVLDDRVLGMWRKICGHVLGERFESSDVIGGRLHVGDLNDEQIEMWRESRPSEYQILLKALAVATQVNIASSSRRGRFETVIASSPEVDMTSSQAAKFREVLKSAAQKSGFILMTPGS